MNPNAVPQPPGEVFRLRMRAAREGRGVSQRQLVERLERFGLPMHQPAVARIEAGQRKASLDEAVAIAAALGHPLEHLYSSAFHLGLSWEDYGVMRGEMSLEEQQQEAQEDFRQRSERKQGGQPMSTASVVSPDPTQERIGDLKEWIRVSEQFVIEVRDEEPERAEEERRYIEAWRTELRELEGGPR